MHRIKILSEDFKREIELRMPEMHCLLYAMLLKEYVKSGTLMYDQDHVILRVYCNPGYIYLDKEGVYKGDTDRHEPLMNCSFDNWVSLARSIDSGTGRDFGPITRFFRRIFRRLKSL